MTIERIVGLDGAIHDKISTTKEENAAIDYCHEILRQRFEARDEEYAKEQKELCEWWLQGWLRFEGMERMIDMAQNAPFRHRKCEVMGGYAAILIADCPQI